MAFLIACSLLSVVPCRSADSLPLAVAGAFAVLVGPGEVEVAGRRAQVPAAVRLAVAPPVLLRVRDERYSRLPLFNPTAAPWIKGAKLRGVQTLETTAPGMLVPDSVRVKPARGDERILRPGKDYELDRRWGTIGRLAGGTLTEKSPVDIDYEYGECRLDSVVVDQQGSVRLIPGTPHVNVPRPPVIPPGTRRVANVWVPGRLERLQPANLFPIETGPYPEPPQQRPTPAERFAPKALAKLRRGGTLRVLAWGDSVTVGTFVPDWQKNRWQEQFVARLEKRFPKARIQLTTVAWGGRSMASFLKEPPGSPHNYKEQVLDRHPDLVVSEFVNDSYLKPAGVERLYGARLDEFRKQGTEWIILTPHYVRPDWMGLSSQRDCDHDPRPYVKGLREFAARHSVALADASLRWGHLWREGIPYTTLLLNSINHPDERGMKLFADALLALFPK